MNSPSKARPLIDCRVFIRIYTTLVPWLKLKGSCQKDVTMSLDSFRFILSFLQVDQIKLLPHPAPPARQVRLQLFLQFDGKRGRSGDRKD